MSRKELDYVKDRLCGRLVSLVGRALALIAKGLNSSPGLVAQFCAQRGTVALPG